MQRCCCWFGQTGVRWYAAEMLKVAAMRLGSKERIIDEVASKVPHSVGTLLGLMPLFTEATSGWLWGKDIS